MNNDFSLEDISKEIFLVPTGNNIRRVKPLVEQVLSCNVFSIEKKFVVLQYTDDDYTCDIRLSKSPVNGRHFRDDIINSGYLVFRSRKECDDYFDRKRMLYAIGTELSNTNASDKEIPLDVIQPFYDYILANRLQ